MSELWALLDIVEEDDCDYVKMKWCPRDTGMPASACPTCKHGVVWKYGMDPYETSDGRACGRLDRSCFPKTRCSHPDALKKEVPEVLPCGNDNCVANISFDKEVNITSPRSGCNKLGLHELTTCPAYQKWLHTTDAHTNHFVGGDNE